MCVCVCVCVCVCALNQHIHYRGGNVHIASNFRVALRPARTLTGTSFPCGESTEDNRSLPRRVEIMHSMCYTSTSHTHSWRLLNNLSQHFIYFIRFTFLHLVFSSTKYRSCSNMRMQTSIVHAIVLSSQSARFIVHLGCSVRTFLHCGRLCTCQVVWKDYNLNRIGGLVIMIAARRRFRVLEWSDGCRTNKVLMDHDYNSIDQPLQLFRLSTKLFWYSSEERAVVLVWLPGLAKHYSARFRTLAVSVSGSTTSRHYSLCPLLWLHNKFHRSTTGSLHILLLGVSKKERWVFVS
jgi:hypothetical protein